MNNNNTVGTTEITPVETEDTKSMKQESRDFSRGRFKSSCIYWMSYTARKIKQNQLNRPR